MIAHDLGISQEQQERMQEIQAGVRSQMMELFQSAGREQAMQKVPELMERVNSELFAVLTDEQNKKLDELKGEAFEMPEDALPPGRGRGGRGGRGGNDG